MRPTAGEGYHEADKVIFQTVIAMADVGFEWFALALGGPSAEVSLLRLVAVGDGALEHDGQRKRYWKVKVMSISAGKRNKSVEEGKRRVPKWDDHLVVFFFFWGKRDSCFWRFQWFATKESIRFG
jgi:hypothetical protein